MKNLSSSPTGTTPRLIQPATALFLPNFGWWGIRTSIHCTTKIGIRALMTESPSFKVALATRWNLLHWESARTREAETRQDSVPNWIGDFTEMCTYLWATRRTWEQYRGPHVIRYSGCIIATLTGFGQAGTRLDVKILSWLRISCLLTEMEIELLSMPIKYST